MKCKRRMWKEWKTYIAITYDIFVCERACQTTCTRAQKRKGFRLGYAKCIALMLNAFFFSFFFISILNKLEKIHSFSLYATVDSMFLKCEA